MNDDREIFGGLRPAMPPPALRERVLAASAAGLAREPRGVWTRIWESRTFRISWAAAAALLAAANVALPARRRRPEAPGSVAIRTSGDGEFGAAVRLPRVDPDAEAWTVIDEKGLRDRFERPGLRPPTKEKSS